MASAVIVDDSDPSVIHTGTWVQGGTIHENDGTVSSSTNPGDTLTFAFAGSQVSVYGTIDSSSGGVTTSYALDGGSAAKVVAPAGGGDTYKQLFWLSPVVSGGNHTLVVTMVKVNTGDGVDEGTVWFDYFQYTPLISATPSTIFSSTSSATSSSAVEAATPGSSETSTTVANSTSKSSSPVGAIVGGVLGALAIIAIIVAMLVFCRRRRRPAKSARYSPPLETRPFMPPTSINSVTPGALSATSRSSYQFSDTPVSHSTHQGYSGFTPYTLLPGTPSPVDAPVSFNQNQLSTQAAASYDPYSGTAQPYVAPSFFPQQQVAPPPTKDRNVVLSYGRNAPPPVQHLDSGIRAGGPTEIPPIYTED